MVGRSGSLDRFVGFFRTWFVFFGLIFWLFVWMYWMLVMLFGYWICKRNAYLLFATQRCIVIRRYFI